MKKLFTLTLIVLAIAVMAQEIVIRLSVPLTSEQRATLKSLRDNMGLTNIPLGEFATNYCSVDLIAAAKDWRNSYQQAICNRLPQCSGDQLDCANAIVTWTNQVDLSDTDKRRMLAILTQLQTCTNLLQVLNRIQP